MGSTGGAPGAEGAQARFARPLYRRGSTIIMAVHGEKLRRVAIRLILALRRRHTLRLPVRVDSNSSRAYTEVRDNLPGYARTSES